MVERRSPKPKMRVRFPTLLPKLLQDRLMVVTLGFGPGCLGSSPSPAAILLLLVFTFPNFVQDQATFNEVVQTYFIMDRVKPFMIVVQPVRAHPIRRKVRHKRDDLPALQQGGLFQRMDAKNPGAAGAAGTLPTVRGTDKESTLPWAKK